MFVIRHALPSLHFISRQSSYGNRIFCRFLHQKPSASSPLDMTPDRFASSNPDQDLHALSGLQETIATSFTKNETDSEAISCISVRQCLTALPFCYYISLVTVSPEEPSEGG